MINHKNKKNKKIIKRKFLPDFALDSALLNSYNSALVTVKVAIRNVCNNSGQD